MRRVSKPRSLWPTPERSTVVAGSWTKYASTIAVSALLRTPVSTNRKWCSCAYLHSTNRFLLWHNAVPMPGTYGGNPATRLGISGILCSSRLRTLSPRLLTASEDCELDQAAHLILYIATPSSRFRQRGTAGLEPQQTSLPAVYHLVVQTYRDRRVVPQATAAGLPVSS